MLNDLAVRDTPSRNPLPLEGSWIANEKTAHPATAPAAENALCSRIIGAAFEAFMGDGYASTNMHEIATRAKVSKRDLYANFPNKQAVLLSCISNRAARMRLSPDLPEPRSREVLASALTTFGATVIREVTKPAVIAMYRLPSQKQSAHLM